MDATKPFLLRPADLYAQMASAKPPHSSEMSSPFAIRALARFDLVKDLKAAHEDVKDIRRAIIEPPKAAPAPVEPPKAAPAPVEPPKAAPKPEPAPPAPKKPAKSEIDYGTRSDLASQAALETAITKLLREKTDPALHGSTIADKIRNQPRQPTPRVNPDGAPTDLVIDLMKRVKPASDAQVPAVAKYIAAVLRKTYGFRVVMTDGSNAPAPEPVLPKGAVILPKEEAAAAAAIAVAPAPSRPQSALASQITTYLNAAFRDGVYKRMDFMGFAPKIAQKIASLPGMTTDVNPRNAANYAMKLATNIQPASKEQVPAVSKYIVKEMAHVFGIPYHTQAGFINPTHSSLPKGAVMLEDLKESD